MTVDENIKEKCSRIIQTRRLTVIAILTPSQRHVGVVGRIGRKKKKARGARWEGEREKRGLFPPFRSSLVPRALSIFFIIAIFIGVPSGSLCGGERMRHYRYIDLATELACSSLRDSRVREV